LIHGAPVFTANQINHQSRESAESEPETSKLVSLRRGATSVGSCGPKKTPERAAGMTIEESGSEVALVA